MKKGVRKRGLRKASLQTGKMPRKHVLYTREKTNIGMLDSSGQGRTACLKCEHARIHGAGSTIILILFRALLGRIYKCTGIFPHHHPTLFLIPLPHPVGPLSPLYKPSCHFVDQNFASISQMSLKSVMRRCSCSLPLINSYQFSPHSRCFHFPTSRQISVPTRPLPPSLPPPPPPPPQDGGIRNAPSNRITSPLIMGFSTIDCTSIANSDGSPSLLGNGTVLPSSFWTCSGRAASIGVLNNPGAIETTLTPSLDRSRARGRVRPATAALEAA